jgi:hypothetical protein
MPHIPHFKLHPELAKKAILQRWERDRIEPIERLKKFLDTMDSDKCWNFEGADCGNGYKGFQLGKTTKLAHRAAYILFVGPIPKGLWICHKCDNKHCCNPSHLFLGTSTDNVRDAMEKRRWFTANRISAANSPRGENHHKSKLKDSDIVAIRARIKKGETQASIAKEYGLWHTTISRIARGIGWKHISHDPTKLTL